MDDKHRTVVTNNATPLLLLLLLIVVRRTNLNFHMKRQSNLQSKSRQRCVGKDMPTDDAT